MFCLNYWYLGLMNGLYGLLLIESIFRKINVRTHKQAGILQAVPFIGGVFSLERWDVGYFGSSDIGTQSPSFGFLLWMLLVGHCDWLQFLILFFWVGHNESLTRLFFIFWKLFFRSLKTFQRCHFNVSIFFNIFLERVYFICEDRCIGYEFHCFRWEN